MTNLPTTYDTADHDAIVAKYGDSTTGVVDPSVIAEAIANYETVPSTIPLEDLISYYIENSGDLPPCMTDLSDPSSEFLNYLWSDPDGQVTETLQEWRQLNSSSSDLTTLVNHLEAFLELGYGETGNVDLQVSNIIDAQSFVDEWEAEQAAAAAAAASATADSTELMTNVMTIARMLMGSPILALLFYITGGETTEDVPEDSDDLPDYMVLNADGESVTIHTDQGDVTAKLGETVTFHTKGFLETKAEFDDAVLEQFTESEDAVNEYMEDLDGISSDDADAQSQYKQIDTAISNEKSNQEILSSMLEVANDIVNNLHDVLSGWVQSDSQTARTIAGNI